MNSIACIVYRYQCLIASSVLKHVADNFTFANVSHVRKVNVSSKTITLATIRHCRHSLKIIREWRKTQFDYRILGSNSNSIQFLSIQKVEFRKQKFSQTSKWNNWTFIATELSTYQCLIPRLTNQSIPILIYPFSVYEWDSNRIMSVPLLRVQYCASTLEQLFSLLYDIEYFFDRNIMTLLVRYS